MSNALTIQPPPTGVPFLTGSNISLAWQNWLLAIANRTGGFNVVIDGVTYNVSSLAPGAGLFASIQGNALSLSSGLSLSDTAGDTATNVSTINLGEGFILAPGPTGTATLTVDAGLLTVLEGGVMVSNHVGTLNFTGSAIVTEVGKTDQVVIDVGGVDVIAPSSGPQIVQSASIIGSGTVEVSFASAPIAGNTVVALVASAVGSNGGNVPPLPTANNGLTFGELSLQARQSCFGADIAVSSSFNSATTIVVPAESLVKMYEVSNAGSLSLAGFWVSPEAGPFGFSASLASTFGGVSGGCGIWTQYSGGPVTLAPAAPSNLQLTNYGQGAFAGACDFELTNISGTETVTIDLSGGAGNDGGDGGVVPYFIASSALVPQSVNTFAIQGLGVQTTYNSSGPTETITIPGLTVSGSAPITQISLGEGLGSTITGAGEIELLLEIPAYAGTTALGAFDAVEIGTGLSGSIAAGTLSLSGTGLEFVSGTESLTGIMEVVVGANLSLSGTSPIITLAAESGAEYVQGTVTATGAATLGAGLTLTGTLNPTITAAGGIVAEVGTVAASYGTLVAGANISLSGTSPNLTIAASTTASANLTFEQGGTSVGTAGTLNAGSGTSIAVAGGVATISATGGGSGGSSPYTTPKLAIFTVGNQPTGSAFSDTSTGLKLSCAAPPSLCLQALVDNTTPASGAFVITCGFNSTQSAGSNNLAGLFVEDSTGKIVDFGNFENTYIGVHYWNNYNSYNAGSANEAVSRVNFLQIQYTGTQFIFSYGTDLNALLVYDTISSTAFLSGPPTKVGLCNYLDTGAISSVFFHYSNVA